MCFFIWLWFLHTAVLLVSINYLVAQLIFSTKKTTFASSILPNHYSVPQNAVTFTLKELNQNTTHLEFLSIPNVLKDTTHWVILSGTHDRNKKYIKAGEGEKNHFGRTTLKCMISFVFMFPPPLFSPSVFLLGLSCSHQRSVPFITEVLRGSPIKAGIIWLI